jgi:predicted MFS family arabinose efflux permease
MATAPGRFSEDRRGGAEHQGIRAGAVFALHDGVLRPVILAWAVVLLGAGFILVAEVAMADLFGQGAFGYGLLTALFGGGAVLGSYLGGRFLSTRREPVALLVSVAATAVAFLLIAVSPWWPLVLVAMMAGGAVEGYGSVAEQGVFQRRTPDAVRSRVNGFVETTVLVSLAVGFGMAGPVVDAFGPRSAYVIGAAGGLIGFLVMLPGMRLLLGRAPSD